MTRLILSEDHAEQIGRERTGGERDKQFVVFLYRHRPSNITCFGVEITATREVIALV